MTPSIRLNAWAAFSAEKSGIMRALPAIKESPNPGWQNLRSCGTTVKYWYAYPSSVSLMSGFFLHSTCLE